MLHIKKSKFYRLSTTKKLKGRKYKKDVIKKRP